VQIAAARARITLDRRRGETTPDWIIALSKEMPMRRVSSYDRRVQIAAARARVTLDRRLKVETPEWIVRLASERPRRR
jgi:hypothetical protein